MAFTSCHQHTTHAIFMLFHYIFCSPNRSVTDPVNTSIAHSSDFKETDSIMVWDSVLLSVLSCVSSSLCHALPPEELFLSFSLHGSWSWSYFRVIRIFFPCIVLELSSSNFCPLAAPCVSCQFIRKCSWTSSNQRNLPVPPPSFQTFSLFLQVKLQMCGVGCCVCMFGCMLLIDCRIKQEVLAELRQEGHLHNRL